MPSHVMTLRSDPVLSVVAHAPLRDSCKDNDAFVIHEHFFRGREVPHSGIVVTYERCPAAHGPQQQATCKHSCLASRDPLQARIDSWNRQAKDRGIPKGLGRTPRPPAVSGDADRAGTVDRTRAVPTLSTAPLALLEQRNWWAGMTASKEGELPFFVAWRDFLAWLLPTTGKLPTHIRFTSLNSIDNLALDLVRGLVRARYSRDKRRGLLGTDLGIARPRMPLRRSGASCYLFHSRAHTTRCENEVGAMLGRPLKHQGSRSRLARPKRSGTSRHRGGLDWRKRCQFRTESADIGWSTVHKR